MSSIHKTYEKTLYILVCIVFVKKITFYYFLFFLFEMLFFGEFEQALFIINFMSYTLSLGEKKLFQIKRTSNINLKISLYVSRELIGYFFEV